MVRRTAALVIALASIPVVVQAQNVMFTISVSSADVYKGPSTGTPVIGHVARGTRLPVARHLGSWLKVEWPNAPDGFAYIHITSGRLGDGTAAANPAATPPPPARVAQTTGSQRPVAPPRERVVIQGQQNGTSLSHVIGMGGVFESPAGMGATARAWRDDRLGVQIAFTREATTSNATRVTALQFEPAVVYGLADFVRDYFWLRPYVGAGLSLRHQTLRATTPAAAELGSDTGVGVRVFGGSEFTFAGAPRFALSVEVGYRRFADFAPRRVTASIGGHWYIK